MVEPSTVNNVATINGTMLGAVVFDTEVLQFIGKDNEPKDEAKLIKNGLLDQFNACLKEFINTGVIAPVTDLPEMEIQRMKKSFILLCYSLANNEQTTTKLRICTNSSLKTQAKTPSFNDICISRPDYLNCLEFILTR